MQMIFFSLLPSEKFCTDAWPNLWSDITKFDLNSWRFSSYSSPIHWLVQDHVTSNNETVYCQIPRAGNDEKAKTLNGKQFTVTRKMLTAVARDQSLQLKVTWRCRWNLIKIYFCFGLLYNKSLNNWSLGKQLTLFPSNLNASLDFSPYSSLIVSLVHPFFRSSPTRESGTS